MTRTDPDTLRMEIYYHATDRDVLILNADGGIDSTSSEGLITDLSNLIDSGARKLIVDCSRLSYISSYGIAVLVRLHKKLAERGGDVKLAAVDSAVTRIIELVGLESVFGLYPTVDAARAAFQR